MTTLAWTLAHFLWQGTLVALAAAVFLRFGPRGATPRYVAGVVALGVMLVTPLATYVVLSRVGSGPAVVAWSPRTVIDAVPSPSRQGSDSGPAGFLAAEPPRWTPLVPIVVSVWALGVLVLSMRLIGGWLVARRLASKVVAPVGPEILAVAARVSTHLGVRRAVRVLESSACAVPVVIGWVRPVVLLPVAALSGLSPVQIEALLAHELAHVRRHDYLVNLLQAVVETLLFYHPGVWWVSRQVRIEREHCCDDLAMSVCDRVEYASALSVLATMTSARGFAMAATDGALLVRVRRILGRAASPRPAASLWLGLATVVAVTALIPTATAAIAFRQADDVPPVVVSQQPASPSPVAASPRRASTAGPPPSAPADDAVPQVSQPATPAVVRESADADQFLSQQVGELERQLRALAEARMDLERERAKEQHRAARAELTVRLEGLRAALQEAKVRSETGLAGISEVRNIEAQAAAVQRSLEALDREAQTRDAEAELLRRQAILQAQYETLRSRQAASVLATESEGEMALRQSRWVAVSHGSRRGWFEARVQPYTQGGPAVTFPVAESDGARTTDGRRISRVRFIGWREGEATRVIALVSVPRDGESNAYTADAARLVERDAGTYLVRFGELRELKDLELLGIRNLWISSVVPVQ
jgi:beta-lactamase regulating signal transducer with metallopeptidase domain